MATRSCSVRLIVLSWSPAVCAFQLFFFELPQKAADVAILFPSVAWEGARRITPQDTEAFARVEIVAPDVFCRRKLSGREFNRTCEQRKKKSVDLYWIIFRRILPALARVLSSLLHNSGVPGVRAVNWRQDRDFSLCVKGKSKCIDTRYADRSIKGEIQCRERRL